MKLVENETLGSMFAATVSRYKARPALEYVGKWWTYEELDMVTDEVAAGMLSLGIKHGTRAGIWANECPDTLFVFLALEKIGAVPVLFNTSWTGEEMRHQSKESGIEALFYDHGYREVNFREVCDMLELPKLKWKFYIGAGIPADIRKAKEAKEEALSKAKAAVRPEDTDMILFTSGSTSSPKGVVTTHYSRVNIAYAQAEMIEADCQDIICVATPIFHCFSLSGNVLAALAVGACICFPKNRRTDSILAAVQEAGCTVLTAVPTLYSALLANRNRASYDLHTLRTGLIGGAGYSEEFFNRICEEFHMELLPSLGQTEATAGVTAGSFSQSRKERATTVGKIIEHVEGRILDVKTGKRCPLGISGEICIRGYNVMKGYLNQPELTTQAIDKEGFLHTGDLGYLDEQGNIHLTGRLKDLIIRGGENIAPGEVEQVLLQDSRIAAVKVLGVPDEHYGEELCACVESVRDEETVPLTEEEVRYLVRKHLAAYKVPRYVFFLEELPLLGNGKLDREGLKKEVFTRLGVSK